MRTNDLIIKCIVISMLLLTNVSCSKLLEENPKGMINENFLATESGLESLVLSQYYQNRLIIENLKYVAIYPTDLYTHGTQGQVNHSMALARTNEMPTLTVLSDLWRDLYAGINNMNFGLKALSGSSFSSSSVMTGELSFFRAWYYLLLVEIWGAGAHFTIEPTSSIVTDGKQGSIDVFYNQILADIDQAITSLPTTTSEAGRIIKPAAMAMKAKVLLALAGYDGSVISKVGFTDKQAVYAEARQLADEVIHNYQYVLLESFEDIFDVNNEGNAETIFSVQFSAENKFNTAGLVDGGHGLHRIFVPNYNRSARTQEIVPRMYGHSIYYGREYRHTMMTLFLLKLFNQQEDARTDATIQTVWRALWDESRQSESDFGIPIKDGQPTDTVLFKPLYDVDNAMAARYKARGIAIDGLNDLYDPNGKPWSAARSWYHTMKKHLDPSRTVPKEEGSHKDVIILRLGEMYLIAAECAHFMGDNGAAAQYIDDLRERARKFPEALPVSSGDIDIDFILDERARELTGELMRWFDLKRTHKLVERVKSHNPDAAPSIQDFHELFPIPQSEMDKVTNRGEFRQNPGYPTK